MKRPLLILCAFGIGVLFTALTAALSYFASQAGAELVSEILFWPNTLMQSLVPLHNIGTAAHPLYQGTLLNLAAFYVSFLSRYWFMARLHMSFFVDGSVINSMQATPTI